MHGLQDAFDVRPVSAWGEDYRPPKGKVDPSIEEKEPNWLPAPEDKFKLVLRLYDPSQKDPSILDGSWTPPPVRRAE